MSVEVALVDFPRLQEQIASRILSEYKVNIHRLDHREAAARLDLFNLVLFFWPDMCEQTAGRLKELRERGLGQKVPYALVASETGSRSAQKILGSTDLPEILLTPLQPAMVSRKLGIMMGLIKPESKAKLDASYVNPFIQATVETLKQMAGMDCARTGLSLRLDAATKGYVSGTMGLSGPAEGFVSLTFDDQLARTIVCRMLQIQPGEEKDEDVRDGVGELMNMIAGSAKADLANTDHSFMLSIPAVIMGGPHTVGQLRGVPVIIIEFHAEGQKFEVMVCLRPRKR
jgi:chemotaxis protein CheX